MTSEAPARCTARSLTPLGHASPPPLGSAKNDPPASARQRNSPISGCSSGIGRVRRELVAKPIAQLGEVQLLVDDQRREHRGEDPERGQRGNLDGKREKYHQRQGDQNALATQ